MSEIPFLNALGDSFDRAVARQPSPRRHPVRGPRLVILAAAGLLAFGGVATGAVLGVRALLSNAPAITLFRDDPQVWSEYNHDHPPADGVIQASVTNVETITIPRVGDIQYWVARTRAGGSCEAFKLPDGTWAGTSRAQNIKYNFGGTVPGCHVPNQSGNIADGGGFDFDEDSFGPSPEIDPHASSDFTFVIFGTVSVKSAVRVRDMQTGRTTPIVDGEFFAITRPARHWSQIRLQTLDRAGKVLSTSWTPKQIVMQYAQHHR